jgi:hypothetical protein
LSCTSPRSNDKPIADTVALAEGPDSSALDVIDEAQDQKDYNTDTLKVEGKAVVFFSLSQEEYDALPEDPNSGVDEVLDDFNYYAGAVADTLQKLGYNTVATGSRHIQIKLNNGTYKMFDRLSANESIVGYIFTDGLQEPRIQYGVGTDIDLLTEFQEFSNGK